MSRCLSERGIDHVVLERGEVANSWRRERWDSLHLFTPAKFDGLEGMPFPAPPDSFPSKDEMAAYLEMRTVDHVHFSLAVAIGGQRLDGDPLWGLLVGAPSGIDDAPAVAGKIADGRVELRQGHFHRGLC